MATNRDAYYSQTPARVRERVEAIYANRGVDLNVRDAMRLTGEVYRGSYSFDDIRTGLESGQYIGTPPPSAGEVDRMPEQHMRGGAAPPKPEQPTVDFYTLAKAKYPWLPDALIRAYAAGLAESNGNAEIGLHRMRSHNLYDQYFAGNRRADGSFRMNEHEYMATKDGYRQTLRDYGLNADLFADRYVSLIEGDVSLAEFGQRLEAANSQLVNNTATVKQWYAENYQLQLSDEAILASFIDPDIGRAVLDRRIAVSQIGGEAAARGFRRSVSDAERLAQAGITQTQARSLYSQAQDQLGTLDALAKRWRDRDSTVELGEFEDAFALGDAGQQRRFQRNLGAERSSFTGQQGRVERDQSGGLSGLTQR